MTTPTKPTTAKRLLLAVATLTILVVTATAVAATQPADDYDPDDVPGALTDIDSRLDSLELSAEARYGHAVRTRGIADAASQDVRYLEADLDALVARVAELEHDRAAMRSELTQPENMVCVTGGTAPMVVVLDWDNPNGPTYNHGPTPYWEAFGAWWEDCGPHQRYRHRTPDNERALLGWCTHSLHDADDAALFEEHPRTAETTDSCAWIRNNRVGSLLWHTEADGWHPHVIDEHGDLPELS